jgi:metallo-beta-lactamase family protein
VILTRAHLDQGGYLPALIKNSSEGPVCRSDAAADLCGILLPDAERLLERDAEFAHRHGLSKRKPALPLYTEAGARAGPSELGRIAGRFWRTSFRATAYQPASSW